MYKITRIWVTDYEHGQRLNREGRRDEALAYIREATDVLKEFDSYMDARQFFCHALGLPPTTNFYNTGQAIYKLR